MYEYWQGFASNTAQFLNELVNAKLISDLSQYLLSAGEFLMIGAAVVAQGTLQLAFALSSLFSFIATASTARKDSKTWPIGFGGERDVRLLDVVGATIKSVVYGTIGTAIAQSILTALGLWLAGVPGVLLLGLSPS